MLPFLLTNLKSRISRLPFRRDRDDYGGGLFVFVREDIPAKICLVKVPQLKIFISN